MTRVRNFTVLLVLAVTLVAGAVMWETRIRTGDGGQQVVFEVTWETTAPANALYQLGGAPWVASGDMGPIEQHKGWRSNPVPYDPHTTYRFKVIQYDRRDVTTLRILLNGHPVKIGDNQRPSVTIPQIELRGS